MAKYAKAKKVNQNKKKSPSVWKKIWGVVKTIFLSLFSNDTCVDGKNKKWYWAVPMGLIAVTIAVIPLGVSQWKQSGSLVLSSPTYSIENGLIAFQESLEDNNLSVKVNATDHKLEIDEAAWNKAYANSNKAFSHTYDKTVTKMQTVTVTDESSSTYTSEVGPVVTTIEHCCDLTVYYFADTENFDTLVTATLKGADVLGNETYSVNALFLGQEKFVLYKKPTAATSVVAKITGYYDGVSFDMKDLTKQDSHGNSYSVSRSAVTSGNSSLYITDSLNAWKTFFNDAWDSQRVTNGWVASGIWMGVYAGTTIVMGFLIWLMCRGRDNPYRSLNLWDTQKIAYWSALCPAIIAMILGFIWTAYVQMYFIFIFGFRIMWMSMKTLRPYQQ